MLDSLQANVVEANYRTVWLDAELLQRVGEHSASAGVKKRVAHPDSGKSGGYRMLVSAKIGSRYVFLHGFPKSDKASIAQDEKRALQFAGKVFLELSAADLLKVLLSGVLVEVHCEQNH